MGVPLFKIRDFVEREHVAVCSSNYVPLRQSLPPRDECGPVDHTGAGGLLHRRVLRPLCPNEEYDRLAREIRRAVLRGVGIPTGIGVAPTKTLAKIASHYSKKHPETAVSTPSTAGGTSSERSRGHPSATCGASAGETSARWRASASRPPTTSSSGHRSGCGEISPSSGWTPTTSCEGCRGSPSVRRRPPRASADPALSATPSRTRKQLEMILLEFLDIVCSELERQHLGTLNLAIYLRTNRFRFDIPQYNPYVQSSFTMPTSDFSQLVPVVRQLLGSIWRPGYDFKKGGSSSLTWSGWTGRCPLRPRRSSDGSAYEPSRGASGSGTGTTGSLSLPATRTHCRASSAGSTPVPLHHRPPRHPVHHSPLTPQRMR